MHILKKLMKKRIRKEEKKKTEKNKERKKTKKKKRIGRTRPAHTARAGGCGARQPPIWSAYRVCLLDML
jgi:hypothetical protein